MDHLSHHVEAHRQEIAGLCRKHGVKELFVFGSVLLPGFSSTSDIDFVVEFDWADETNLSSRFLGLKSGLESLLGRPADLVCYSAIRNPYFKKAVDSQKHQLYAA